MAANLTFGRRSPRTIWMKFEMHPSIDYDDEFHHSVGILDVRHMVSRYHLFILHEILNFSCKYVYSVLTINLLTLTFLEIIQTHSEVIIWFELHVYFDFNAFLPQCHAITLKVYRNSIFQYTLYKVNWSALILGKKFIELGNTY